MISIVIPVLNERESVAALHAEIVSVMKELTEPYEIIFIDDGSTDGTFGELSKLKPVKVIRFTRRFGKSQALQAGFDEARGELIITMDGDLQDDPHEIPNFLKQMRSGQADLIVGWKQRRLDPGNKKIASRLANGITAMFTGVQVHDMNCCFKLYKNQVAKELVLYGDLHRYIPALVASQGYKVEEMPVNHRARRFGVSKYGFNRLFAGIFDFFSVIFLRKFTDRPMHFFGAAGFIFGTIGLIILIYLTIMKIFADVLIGNRPLLMLGTLLLLLGVQLLSLGFVGDLIIRSGPTGARRFVVKEGIER